MYIAQKVVAKVHQAMQLVFCQEGPCIKGQILFSLYDSKLFYVMTNACTDVHICVAQKPQETS